MIETKMTSKEQFKSLLDNKFKDHANFENKVRKEVTVHLSKEELMSAIKTCHDEHLFLDYIKAYVKNYDQA